MTYLLNLSWFGVCLKAIEHLFDGNTIDSFVRDIGGNLIAVNCITVYV